MEQNGRVSNVAAVTLSSRVVCLERSENGVALEAPANQLKQICCEVLPAWRGIEPSAIQVSAVSGGITNSLFKLAANGVKPVLGRVYGPYTEMLIDRDLETKRMATLSKCGFGAQVLGKFHNGRFETFLDSRPLEPSEMGDPHMIARIAERLADFHNVELDEPRTSQLSNILSEWLQKIDGLRFKNETKQQYFEQYINLKQIKESMKVVHAFLNNCTVPVVLSHNDLLSGNVLLLRNEERPFSLQNSPFTFIDFEYSCYAFRGFDIGNHFNEYAGFDGDFESSFPSKEQQKQFFDAYLKHSHGRPNIADQPSIDSLMREAQLFSVLSHLYWGIWALIQARYSPIDFDFLTYTRTRLDQFLKNMPLLMNLEI